VQYDYLYVGGPRTNVTVLDESGAVVQHINYHLGLEGELLEVSGGTEPVALHLRRPLPPDFLDRRERSHHAVRLR
jgi:hypothetical protein